MESSDLYQLFERTTTTQNPECLFFFFEFSALEEAIFYREKREFELRIFLRTSNYLIVISCFLTIVGLLEPLSLLGQTWQRHWGWANDQDYAIDVSENGDGGYSILGLHDQGGPFQAFIVRTDRHGNTLSQVLCNNHQFMETHSGVRAHNGNFLLGGQPLDLTLNQVTLSEIDGTGDTVWTRNYTINTTLHAGYGGFGIYDILRTDDGGYLCTGYKGDDLQNYDGFALKVDGQGNELWSQTYGQPGNSSQFREVINGACKLGNGYLLAGYQDVSLIDPQAWLIQTDAQGVVVWDTLIGTGVLPDQFLACVELDDAHAAGLGRINAQNALILKIDSASNVEWVVDHGLPGTQFSGNHEAGYNGVPTADGGLALVGQGFDFNSNTERAYVLKVDSLGAMDWQRHYGQDFIIHDFAFRHIINTPEGGYMVAGSTRGWGLGSPDVYGVRMDSLGHVASNLVLGSVQSDYNDNCVMDGTDGPLANWYIRFAGDQDTLYTVTDTLGRFSLDVDSGVWRISAIPPNVLWGNSTCSQIIDTVTFNGTSDTALVSFPFTPAYLCPEMHIDVAAPYFRRCFPNRHDVLYCNQGTKVADSVYFEVQFDPWFTVDSATVNWTTALPNNTFRWFVDTMAPGSCGSVRVFTTLNCDSTVTGQTHCVEANIFPDTLCTNPPPNWDGAELKIQAECVDDSIEFKVTNIGGGDMLSATTYIIVEDDLMIINNNIQLQSGQSFLHNIGGSGPTYRMEATQTPGYPGYLIPAVTVEGCGVDSNGNFSLGHVITQEMDDRAPWTSIDCQESIASYDPNDKRGYPFGTDTSHLITDSTSIEYKIRFQNTGSDTAFNVVIRDTLSPFLDPLTVDPGASSDPYSYSLDNNNVLVFTFANIMLPDSNVNEPASHGYVTFEVHQTPGNPLGTVIENEADIYFDFNPPVITNRTFHTIADSLVKVMLWSVPEHREPLHYRVRVFPNPAQETVYFQVQDHRFDDLRLEIVDLSGRVVKTRDASHTDRLSMQRGNLSSGVYLYRLIGDEQLISVGRVVLP